MIYLDWASTSPPEPSILAESTRVAETAFGNPSSRHSLGYAARAALDKARERFSAALAPPEGANRGSGRIVFTGGGSEADSIPILALVRSALASKKDGTIKPVHIVTSSIEHSAVFEQVKLLESLGLSATYVDPEADGRLDPRRVGAAVRGETALVAIMAVNNETGAIQPLAEIAASIAEASAALHRPRPRLHADAVQALGKIPFHPAAIGIDTAAFSAHKIRGPRGVGALWTADPIDTLALGGGQEGGMRAGTENLHGAWAFALAAERAVAGGAARERAIRALEARLFDGLAAAEGALPLPAGRRAGDPRYSPYILSVAFPGLSGEVLVRALSDAAIAVSTGAACASNSRRKSRRVLEAMGVDAAIAFSSIRVSLGETTSEADIDAFLESASSLYRKLRT